MWPSVAVGVVIAFPGYTGAICLGQNSLLSLALLVLGWLLTSRGRPWLGGVVWGLLAFKPVWAASFFLVPLLMRRWRMCAAMLLTGLALGLLTLPFVGVQAWMDWLTVGRQAAAGYSRLKPGSSSAVTCRAFHGRWLLDFTADGDAIDPDRPLPNLIGLSLWLAVAGLDRACRPVLLAASPAGGTGRAAGRVPDAGRVARLLSLHVLRHAAGGAAGLPAVHRQPTTQSSRPIRASGGGCYPG